MVADRSGECGSDRADKCRGDLPGHAAGTRSAGMGGLDRAVRFTGDARQFASEEPVAGCQQHHRMCHRAHPDRKLRPVHARLRCRARAVARLVDGSCQRGARAAVVWLRPDGLHGAHRDAGQRGSARPGFPGGGRPMFDAAAGHRLRPRFVRSGCPWRARGQQRPGRPGGRRGDRMRRVAAGLFDAATTCPNRPFPRFWRWTLRWQTRSPNNRHCRPADAP